VTFIGSLRDVLDPLFEHTPFAPLEVGPDALEYGGALDDGRVVLFGFYHGLARRTVTAALWTVPASTPGSGEAARCAEVERHRAWDYGQTVDADGLAREIVAEVVAWLQPPSPTSGPESGTLPGD
jgi:hypothetical protein